MSEGKTITISLNAVKLFAHHGAYAEERERGNHFEIDLTVELPIPHAAESDLLDETIDYVSLVECIHLVSAEKHYSLLEAFAFDLANEVLELHPEVLKVTVEVRKLRPMIPHELESVGVKISLP